MNITRFVFESQEIRFVDGKPVANDVAIALGYKNPADATYRLVNVENSTLCKIQTVDGKLREVKVLEEAGIYQLIFSSKLPSARQFQYWVFNEVLPSIRKTGSYSTQPKTTAEMFAMAGQALLEHEQKIKELEATAYKHQAHLLDQSSKLEVIRQDVDMFKAIHYQNVEALNFIEPPTVEVKPKPRTAQLNEFIRKYAINKNILFKDCYNKVYREFRDRYQIDLKERGKNKYPKLSGIKMAAELDKLEELFAVAVEVLV